MAKGYAAVRILGVMIVLASCTWFAFGDATTEPADVKFKSADATNAVNVEATAEAKAKAEYDKALVAAKTKLIAELEVVKEKTTKMGDLDEALKLRDKITELKDEIDMLEGKPSVVGDWNCVNSEGWQGDMQFNADGTALEDHRVKGRWAIEHGNLVVRWGDGKDTSTFTEGTADKMTGKGSMHNETLVVTRVKK